MLYFSVAEKKMLSNFLQNDIKLTKYYLNYVFTGEIKSVKNGPMDLLKKVKLGERFKELPGGKGFDHTYCFGQSGEKKLMAR